MTKLSCYLLTILLVLAILGVTSARRPGCSPNMRNRSDYCRNMFSMFKRLLQDMDEDEDEQRVDEERELPPETETDEEADLRALLYGQVPEDDPMDTEERMPIGEEDEDLSAYKRKLELRRRKLEMDLVEELLRDLENFDINEDKE